jgi:Secretion system C-terminal sorting domain
MKTGTTTALIVSAMLVSAITSFAQAPRKDVIWARTTNGAAITLDGVLDEPAWALAESIVVRYGHDSGIPGSGWKDEGGGVPAYDSSYAVIKLLTVGNQMYMGATVRDSSVGGSFSFNKFDGFLMSIKNHLTAGHPSPPNEYFYSWWYPSNSDPQPAGRLPSFKGVWATLPVGSTRTPEQIANWDAVTIVHGVSNSDAVPDTGYTVEMRFNLTPEGYDITKPAGDIVEWNISVYDSDWFWPNTGRNSANRVWWQGPWGGDALYNEVRVYSKPSVTIASGALPVIAPELIIPNAAGYLSPTIDGHLTESVWAAAPSFDIRYGDDALRATYPGVFPFRAGQYQPPVSGGQAFIDDPGDATVKYFFKEDTLYLGFDVRDRKVEYVASFDRWDGALVSINDRAVVGGDQNLVGRRLSFQIAQNGTATAQDYLAYLKDVVGAARLAASLKPGTTVDTTGLDNDTGYQAELAIDLTSLGYPKGRGDGVLFMGINLLDGDSYTPFTDSYGDRTWWMREYEGTCCPTWAYMNPNVGVTGVDDPTPAVGTYFRLGGNAPNPFQTRTQIHFTMARPGDVALDVYDVQGRLVESRALGTLQSGERSITFDRQGLKTGVYLYRLKMMDHSTRTLMATLSGNMLVIR